MLSLFLVGREQALGQAPRLEQGEAQQHRIAHTRPDRRADVGADGDPLHQHSVDRHTHHDEKRLEAQREQRFQIVLAYAAPFLAQHSGHRDRGHAGDKVYLKHTAIGDDENADGQRPHGNTHEQRLHPQAQQRSQVHRLKPSLHVGHDGS